jgi:arylsulfatase
VAELLRDAGYATYMTGKWHLTPWPGPGHNLPRRRGFDGFYGILASIRSYYSPPSLMRDDEPLPPPAGVPPYPREGRDHFHGDPDQPRALF